MLPDAQSVDIHKRFCHHIPLHHPLDQAFPSRSPIPLLRHFLPAIPVRRPLISGYVLFVVTSVVGGTVVHMHRLITNPPRIYMLWNWRPNEFGIMQEMATSIA